MKFYYGETGYQCIWKHKLNYNYTWSNMEWAIIKVRIPFKLYETIIADLKKDDELANLRTIFKFRIHKERDELANWDVYNSIESELWKFSTYLERVSYSSKFNDDTVMAHFEFLVREHNKCDKSELRDILLSELV